MSDLSLVPELAIAAAPKPVGEIGGSVPKRGSSGSSDGSGSRAKPPQPVDLTVPAGIDVVAVTGPNTGARAGL